MRILCFLSLFSVPSLHALVQSSAFTASGGELPLLTVIGAGILGGGIWSALKTRHQK
jgi:hypothetical protein